MPPCSDVFVTDAALAHRRAGLFRMAGVPMLGLPLETGLLIA